MLELQHLKKGYDRILFSDLSLTFPDRGLAVILGPSGCGKSTILNLIAGLEMPDGGRILFRGKPVVTKREFSLFRRKHVLFLFQDYGLIESSSVELNLRLPQMIAKRRSAKAELLDALKKVGVEKRLKDRCLHLSGGEKQRIALARCLLFPKDVILCDEPTGSLDEENTKIVFRLLKELAERSLVIVVTHDRNLGMAYADMIFDMESGAQQQKRLLPAAPLPDAEVGHFRVSDGVKLSLSSLLFRRGRTLLSVLSYVFVLLFFLVSFSLKYSIRNSLSEQYCNYLDYNRLQVSLEEASAIGDTHFQFVRSARPDHRALEEALRGYPYQIAYCFDSLLGRAGIYAGTETVTCSFKPVGFLHDTKYSSYYGIVSSMGIGDVIVNEAALQVLQGKPLRLSLEAVVETYDESFNHGVDAIVLDTPLKIVATVAEFDFMSVPTVYYSYQAYLRHFRTVFLPGASILYQRRISLYDRLSAFSRDDEELSAYCYDLYARDGDIGAISSLLRERGFSVRSFALETAANLTNVFCSIEQVLLLFVLLSFCIALLLIGMVLYSFVVDRRKEIGLLAAFGAEPRDIRKMFCLEGGLLSGAGAAICLLLIAPALSLINRGIAHFFQIEHLLQLPLGIWNGTVLGLEAAVIGSSVLIGIACGFLPSSFACSISVGSVLREE